MAQGESRRPRGRDEPPRGHAPARREIEVEDEPLARRRRTGEDRRTSAPPVRAPRQTSRRGAGAVQLAHLRRVRLARDEAHPRAHRLRELRAHRGPRRERRGERPQLGTNERGRAGPGRLQPGGLSPAQGNPCPAVPGAAGKPWVPRGPCEAGARQAPGSKESTGFLSLSESARILSEWTEFVSTHSVFTAWKTRQGRRRPSSRKEPKRTTRIGQRATAVHRTPGHVSRQACLDPQNNPTTRAEQMHRPAKSGI